MPYKLSPSSLNLFKECPRCFWLHHNKQIRRPAGIFPSLPSGMDAILKNHFDSFMEKGKLPPELVQEHITAKLFDNLELLKIWRNNRKGIQWTDEKGNLLRGAVDNILMQGKKLIVLDYKTRGFPLKENTAAFYEDQLNIYNFLLRKNNYETEDFGYLLFYYPTEVDKNGEVIFETELVKLNISTKRAEELWKDALKCLEGDCPESSEECGWCRWLGKRR